VLLDHFIELLPKSPSNGGVALFGKTTQNGFIDFQLVSTELYRSVDRSGKHRTSLRGTKQSCVLKIEQVSNYKKGSRLPGT